MCYVYCSMVKRNCDLSVCFSIESYEVVGIFCADLATDLQLHVEYCVCRRLQSSWLPAFGSLVNEGVLKWFQNYGRFRNAYKLIIETYWPDISHITQAKLNHLHFKEQQTEILTNDKKHPKVAIMLHLIEDAREKKVIPNEEEQPEHERRAEQSTFQLWMMFLLLLLTGCLLYFCISAEMVSNLLPKNSGRETFRSASHWNLWVYVLNYWSTGFA